MAWECRALGSQGVIRLLTHFPASQEDSWTWGRLQPIKVPLLTFLRAAGPPVPSIHCSGGRGECPPARHPTVSHMSREAPVGEEATLGVYSGTQ